MSVINLSDLFPMGKDGTRQPLPKQKLFQDLVLDPKGPTYVGYFGGYGCAKSLILCHTMLTQGILYGGEYVIAREFMPELRRTTMRQFNQMVPKALILDMKEAVAETYVRSAVGTPAIFYFVGLEAPEKLDSLNLSGAGIDEGSQTTEEAFLKLQGRLRNPLGLRKMIVVGNPKGKNWVYRRFVSKKDLQSDAARAKYAMVTASSTENKHLPDGYVQNMLDSYSPERIKRDVYGSWDSFEGQIYGEFERAVHVIPPFKIPDSWTRIVGADHGYTNPAAFLWGAVNHDGDVFVYRELYERELLVSEISKKFTEMTGKEKIDAIYIDPSTKAVRSQTGASDFDAYLEALPQSISLLPAKNEVGAGIDRVKSYLKVSERTHKPRLYIFDTCVELLDEITEYQWEPLSSNQEGKQNQKEQPRKYRDHSCDALRYMLMSRPETPADPAKIENSPFPTMQSTLRADYLKHTKPQQKDPFEGS